MDKRNFKIIENGVSYALPKYKVEDGVGIVETGESVIVEFVRGSKLKEETVEKKEGTLHEHLLSALIHDLEFKNALVPSREGALALTNLQQARMWMEERQKSRQAANVAGTYQKH